MNMDASALREELRTDFAVMSDNASEPLRECVREALQRYFQQMDGHSVNGLYEMVLSEVEEPMLETVMHYTRGNQTKAAGLLGISRSTLRKKLSRYRLD